MDKGQKGEVTVRKEKSRQKAVKKKVFAVCRRLIRLSDQPSLFSFPFWPCRVRALVWMSDYNTARVLWLGKAGRWRRWKMVR